MTDEDGEDISAKKALHILRRGGTVHDIFERSKKATAIEQELCEEPDIHIHPTDTDEETE